MNDFKMASFGNKPIIGCTFIFKMFTNRTRLRRTKLDFPRTS